MVRQSKRFAYESYNPTWSSAETILKHQADFFGQGFYKGRYAKSGGALAMKQLGKGVLWGASFGKSPNWLPRLYRNLKPEDRKILGNWMLWGVPDVPILQKTWKELGGAAAGGMLLRQLISKFFFVSLFVTAARMVKDFIQDNMTPEKEYSGWGDSDFNKMCVWAHRFSRAVDWASFGVISPAAWVANLLLVTIAGGTEGGGEILKKRVHDYLLGENEENVPKLPPETILWFKTNTKKIKQNTENAIKKGEQLKDTLLSGQDVNIKELVPDGSVRKEQDTTAKTQTNQKTTNTDSIKTLLFNHLKTIPSLNNNPDPNKKIGPDDKPYIFDKGNNVWDFRTAGDSIMKFQYNPQNKTFSQIK
jgi:hypothetical protein